MGDSLADVSAHLAEQDLGLFGSLRTGSRTMAEVVALLPRTGLQDPETVRGIGSMAAAYARLRNRYGSEWLRFRTGQPLSAEELRRFQALQALQAQLAGRFELLRARALAAGDATTAEDLDRLASQAHGIAEALPTLDKVLGASVAADAIQGEYDAVRTANPDDEPEWNATDAAVGDLRTDSSVGFVFTTDLKTVQQWSFVREETDVPAGGADDDVPGAPAAPGALDEALKDTAVLAGEADPDTTDEMEEAEAEEMAADEEPAGPIVSNAPAAVPAVPVVPAASPAPAQDLPKPPLRGFLL